MSDENDYLNVSRILGNQGGDYSSMGNYSNVNSLGQMSQDSVNPLGLNFSSGMQGFGTGGQQEGGIFSGLMGGGGGGGFMDSMGGLGGMLGGVGDIMGAYAAMKNYGLAEDSLDFQKDAYSTDLANKAQLINEKRKYQAERQSLYGGGSQADVAAAGAQSDATGVRDKI